MKRDMGMVSSFTRAMQKMLRLQIQSLEMCMMLVLQFREMPDPDRMFLCMIMCL